MKKKIPAEYQPAIDRYRGKFRLGASVSDEKIYSTLVEVGKLTTRDEEAEKLFAEKIK